MVGDHSAGDFYGRLNRSTRAASQLWSNLKVNETRLAFYPTVRLIGAAINQSVAKVANGVFGESQEKIPKPHST